MMINRLKYFLIITISLWLIGFWFMFKTNTSLSGDNSQLNKISNNDNLNNNNNNNNNKDLVDVIKRLERDLTNLETKYKQNELIIQSLSEKAALADNNNRKIDLVQENGAQLQISNHGPTILHEETRRKLYNDVKDVSFYINSQLSQLQPKSSSDLSNKIKQIELNFQDRINVILSNLYNLSQIDSNGDWRLKESRKLGEQVQLRFKTLQNPKDCKTAKKILCDLNKACGFGCQMHHVMYCFITAFFNDRVMILDSNNWRYNTAGYQAYFMPVTETCNDGNYDDNAVNWNEADISKSLNVKMPIIDVLTNRPNYLPQSVPKYFLEKLNKFHGDPFVWWAGHVLSYLMRFNNNFKSVVDENRSKLKFVTPCVGVHVRRSDKVGSEAAFHGLDEYMKHVDDFFNLYELIHPKLNSRNVYLATDEPGVLLEAKSKYPHYNFIFDESNAKSAAVNKRYSPDSAQGVILDTYFLSECDYLVCTFSSQVCRMSYELMQLRYPDASWRFKSLDDVYYYGGQNAHDVEAIYDHVANKQNGEIDLKVGDRIGLAGNHWDGYSKGQNRRTGQEGLFPSYKVKNVIQSV